MTPKDGFYLARLQLAHVRQTDDGRPYVAFVWLLEKPGLERTSVLCPVRGDGQPNAKAIERTRAWAKRWDGANIEWFGWNLRLLKQVPVLVRLANDTVVWVGPVQRDDTDPTLPTFASEQLAQVPDGLQPTMDDTLRLFAFLMKGRSRSRFDAVWTALRDTVRPADVDQIDFTPDDWIRFQNLILRRETKLTQPQLPTNNE